MIEKMEVQNKCPRFLACLCFDRREKELKPTCILKGSSPRLSLVLFIFSQKDDPFPIKYILNKTEVG